MTSRVISAVLIAVVIASICLASALYTSNFAEDVTERTREIYSNANESNKKISELRDRWRKYSDTAALYMEHSDLEDVTVLIERIKETDTESEHMFKMDCREIELQMEHFKESQMPKLYNIF